MTKNQIFTEIKLAMKAGHYRDLSMREKKIYKNAFKNGYKLSKLHSKINKIYIKRESYKPVRIVGHSFAKPSKRIIDSIINRVCVRYEVHKETLMSKVRTQDMVRARNIIHNLLFEKYNLNLTDIGRYFGQDHTTVLHSIEMKKNKRRFWDSGQSIWEEFADLKAAIS